jgi:hypothetical protein
MNIKQNPTEIKMTFTTKYFMLAFRNEDEANLFAPSMSPIASPQKPKSQHDDNNEATTTCLQ